METQRANDFRTQQIEAPSTSKKKNFILSFNVFLDSPRFSLSRRLSGRVAVFFLFRVLRLWLTTQHRTRILQLMVFLLIILSFCAQYKNSPLFFGPFWKRISRILSWWQQSSLEYISKKKKQNLIFVVFRQFSTWNLIAKIWPRRRSLIAVDMRFLRRFFPALLTAQLIRGQEIFLVKALVTSTQRKDELNFQHFYRDLARKKQITVEQSSCRVLSLQQSACSFMRSSSSSSSASRATGKKNVKSSRFHRQMAEGLKCSLASAEIIGFWHLIRF